jgi:NAD(P)-dependent dehydrogenase (short-subunit alcohol dehydrogenase family)
MRLDTVHGLRTVVNTSSLGTTASICPGWVDTPMNRKLAEELGGMDKLGPIIKRQQPLPLDDHHPRGWQRRLLPRL